LKESAPGEETLSRYLLGQMSELELDELDERHFGDRDFIERLLAAEDELIDSYVRGELSSSDRRRFEEHFMRSRERRRRVAFARRWMHLVATRSKTVSTGIKTKDIARGSRPWVLRLSSPWAMVPLAACIILVSMSLLLALQIARLRGQIDDLRTTVSIGESNQRELERQLGEQRIVSSQLRDELARGGGPQESRSAAQPEPGLVAFVLTPGLQRSGGDSTRLLVPADAKQVRLQADFKVGDYPFFSAHLETVEGVEVWKLAKARARQTPGGKMLIVTIPAAKLAEQDYVLTVSGIPPTGQPVSVGEYSFRVVRK
jgi:hypothetical protein